MRSVRSFPNFKFRISSFGLHESPITAPTFYLYNPSGTPMIVGTGIDIAEVDRIAAAIRRHGDHFLQRLFTPAEIAYCEKHRDKFQRYAARFAAKEAAMKALGTGWRKGVRWLDIEVTRLPSGQPSLRLAGQARQFADALGVKNIALSITHSGNSALAQVIFES